MARGINKVILIGNLGQDPEVRYFPNGGAVCNVTVATTDTWKDRQTGEQREATEWHRVVFGNRLAEIAGEFLRKGSKVYVEGSLRSRKYQDNQGQERYITEIRANEMQMLDSRGAGQGAQGSYGGQAPQQGGYNKPQGQGGYSQPQQQGYAQQAPQQNYGQGGGYQQGGAPKPQSAPQQQPKPAEEPPLDFDDDIPF